MFRTVSDAPCADERGQTQSTTFCRASGKLHATTGSVTIIRGRDVVRVTVGDLLYAGDVIETGPDGTAGITFIDGTAFTLLNNSRLLLNEFAYHPNGFANSALFRLDRGSCSFIAGSAAKSDQLRLETPIATIRATAQDAGIAILTMAALLFCSIRQSQGSSPDLVLADDSVDDDLVTYGTYNLTTKGAAARVIPIEHPGEIIVLHPFGSGMSVERLTTTPEQMETFRELYQATRELLHATSGSGTPPSLEFEFHFQPINFIQPVDYSITVTSHDIAPTDHPIHDIIVLPPSLPSAPGLALAKDSGNASDLVTNNGTTLVSGVLPGATVLFSTDGITWTDVAPQYAADGTDDGVHTIAVMQIDTAGHKSAASSITFTLDTIAPTANLSFANPEDNNSSTTFNGTNVASGVLSDGHSRWS